MKFKECLHINLLATQHKDEEGAWRTRLFFAVPAGFHTVVRPAGPICAGCYVFLFGGPRQQENR